MNDGLADVREYLAGLKAGGARWLVGVSGGGDSVALLRLLVEAGLGGQVVVGCFNHGWGRFGDESACFVDALAGTLGIGFRMGTGSGKAGSNAEAVARTERYSWFAEVCAAEGLAGMMVAHTRDDVVETFLMRAGKGSGLGGLAGMQGDIALGGLRLMRPMLAVEREELRAYLRGLGQAWMEDPDNEAGGSQRARVRKLLPALEAAGITLHGLAASVASLSEADALVRQMVDGFEVEVIDGVARIARAELIGAPVELAVRVLARVIRDVTGDTGVMVRRGKRVALWERITREEDGAATLGGAKFVWRNGTVTATLE